MAHKRPTDPRGGHCRIYWEIIDSMAWKALDWSARGLYVEMRRKLQSTNNGNIEATLGTLRHAGFRSAATLSKGLRALQTVGLIAMTRQGGIAVGQKVCSLYRFTDEATFEHPKLGVKASPAGHEWRQFTTIAEARKALVLAHKAVKRDKPEAPENKSGLQKLNRLDSTTEASARNLDSVSERVTTSLLQKLNKTARSKSAASPHQH